MLLARHGFSEHNSSRPGILDAGDPPLHRDGHAQALRLAGFLRDRGGIDVVLSSPQQRALQTAGYIVRATGAQLDVDSRLKEYDWGLFGGMHARTTLGSVQPEIDRLGFDYRPPEGETMTEVADRYCEFVSDASTQYDGLTVAVVSHKFSTQCYIGKQLGLTREETRNFPIGNCALLAFDPLSPAPPVDIYQPAVQTVAA